MSTNDATDMEPNNISMDSVVEGTTDRGIPIVKYIEDIGGFAEQFTPPASAELLIGAYTDLFSKFKTYEARLTQKSKSKKCEESYCLSYCHAVLAANDSHTARRPALLFAIQHERYSRGF